MPKAIVVEETGSPSVMKWRDIEIGRPAKGEVTVRARAIGGIYTYQFWYCFSR